MIAFPITTERLLLRPFTPEDVDPILQVYGDPQVMRYGGEGSAADGPAAERMGGYRSGGKSATAPTVSTPSSRVATGS